MADLGSGQETTPVCKCGSKIGVQKLCSECMDNIIAQIYESKGSVLKKKLLYIKRETATNWTGDERARLNRIRKVVIELLELNE